MVISRLFFLFVVFSASLVSAQDGSKVTVGLDVLFEDSKYLKLVKGKKVGLITNSSSVNRDLRTSLDLFREHTDLLTLSAIFAPEHGLNSSLRAWESFEHSEDDWGIPVYSLHGQTRRPNASMLEGLDVLVYDIQDIGSRSYTYATTLFYCMEEAAKEGIPLIVLDRPNPMNGVVVDGPFLEDHLRSFVGYINVPYCHGMTIGELAGFFNGEYSVGCDLKVIPMKGWDREMSFEDTGLHWIPTSPYLAEEDTPWYYPTTGILGELQIINIGIGYTSPFKLVGAPWIDANILAKNLNKQNYPGVQFVPIDFRPFYGSFKNTDCQGVRIIITDKLVYKPVSTQYLILGILKSLYPQKMEQALHAKKNRLNMFHKVNGSEEIFRILTEERYSAWKLRGFQERERQEFLKYRKKYLIPDYETSS